MKLSCTRQKHSSIVDRLESINILLEKCLQVVEELNQNEAEKTNKHKTD